MKKIFSLPANVGHTSVKVKGHGVVMGGYGSSNYHAVTVILLGHLRVYEYI